MSAEERGASLDLYVDEYTWHHGKQYGQQIQDFRRPNLSGRLEEEDKRIELTRKEAKKGKISAWNWIGDVLTLTTYAFVFLPYYHLGDI